MSLNLTLRMKKIIELCEPAECIVDVGTDHGKVPIQIANMGLAKKIIAIDEKRGPFKKCVENKILYMKNENVDFEILQSDGLKEVDKYEEVGIIITGMGFDTIKQILFEINDYNFKYIIISPHTKIEDMKKFLQEKKIYIERQIDFVDKKKQYHIIKAKKLKGEI